MLNACNIFSKKDNKPESNYGSTRSTLFGKFYERIISKWLEEVGGYSLERWANKAVHKPRIYWYDISLDNFEFNSRDWLLKSEVSKSLEDKKKNNNYCNPDGAFKKNTAFYIWEAKNWPLYPEKGPKPQIRKYLISNPWIFANKFNLSGKEIEISGFLFSFWHMKSEDKTEIEDEINKIIGKNKFKIIFNRDILNDCIKKKYEWYIKIIKQEKENVDEFFDQLLGE